MRSKRLSHEEHINIFSRGGARDVAMVEDILDYDRLNTEVFDAQNIPTPDDAIESITQGLTDLITICGDDASRNGLEDTPYRVAKAFMEYTKGYDDTCPEDHLRKTFEVDSSGMVLIKDIPFNSLCEHHFAPFTGVAHIAYLPGDTITGLSKFARLVDGYANRFQVQERLTDQILTGIVKVLNPKGAFVMIEAEHYCMCGRGVKKAGAKTVTTATSGSFNSAGEMALITNLIKG